MDRRSFIGKLIGIGGVTTAGILVPKISYFFIHGGSGDLWGIDGELADNQAYMYGIPYHYNDGSMGEWLGFDRKIYDILASKKVEVVSSRSMRIPLELYKDNRNQMTTIV